MSKKRYSLYFGIAVTLASLLPTGCGTEIAGSHNPSAYANEAAITGPWIRGFTRAGVSADIHANQGYAYGTAPDGTDLHYFFASRTLTLSSTYLTLTPLASSDALLPNTDHQGAGDYYDGRVYSVVQDWHGCSVPDGPIDVEVFDGTSLAPLSSADITAYQPEASGMTIDRHTGKAIVSSYCVPDKLFVYDRTNWQLEGTIPLPIHVGHIQGVSWRRGFVYIGNAEGQLYGLRMFDGTMRLLLSAGIQGEFEGPDFHSAQLRWLKNDGTGHYLYLFNPEY